MIADGEYIIIDGVEFDEKLIHECLIYPDKSQVRDEIIWPYARDILAPLAISSHGAGHRGAFAATAHVLQGNYGVGVHDHGPYLLTAILYLTDAEGALVVDPLGEAVEVFPKAGRLVIIRGSTVHSAHPSPHPELRVGIVCDISDSDELRPLAEATPEGLDKDVIFTILRTNRWENRDNGLY